MTGIRPFNDQSIRTLLVDSLVETNLGMPIAYGIYVAIRKKWGNEADTDDILPCVHCEKRSDGVKTCGEDRYLTVFLRDIQPLFFKIAFYFGSDMV